MRAMLTLLGFDVAALSDDVLSSFLNNDDDFCIVVEYLARTKQLTKSKCMLFARLQSGL